MIMIENFPGMTALIDENLRCIEVNESYVKNFNMFLSDFKNKKWGFHFLNSQPNAPEIIENFMNSNEQNTHFESSIEFNDKTQHVMIICKKNNQNKTAIVTCIDLTYDKQLEQRNINTSKMSSIGEMAGGIAHEVNNPLTVISTQAQLLKMSIDNERFNIDFLNKSIELILRGSQRISSIIGKLKTFALNDQFQSPINISIKQLIDETMIFCKTKFKTQHVLVYYDHLSEDICIECYPHQLVQVLLNLFNNSYEAMENLNEKWIKIEAIEKNSKVEISITDSGHGISEKNQQRLFQPFFSTKNAAYGTGLGLSNALGYVQFHNGRIHYDKSSKNTRFIIELPKEINQQKKIA